MTRDAGSMSASDAYSGRVQHGSPNATDLQLVSEVIAFVKCDVKKHMQQACRTRVAEHALPQFVCMHYRSLLLTLIG